MLTPVAELSGAVDGVADTGEPQPLHRALHGADLAVDLHGKGPQSTELLLAARSRRLAGPVPPRLRGPPPRPWHRVLWAGRTGDPPGSVPDPGLLELTVPDVLAAARSAMKHGAMTHWGMTHGGMTHGGMTHGPDRLNPVLPGTAQQRGRSAG